MGTRADFYVGKGKNAEWLGSIAYDGYPDGIPEGLLRAISEKGYREEVAGALVGEEATLPEDGWPWPWEDSRTTDYAYAFFDGKVLASNFGRAWFDPLRPETNTGEKKEVVFPNMKSQQNVALGPRSGVMTLLVPKDD